MFLKLWFIGFLLIFRHPPDKRCNFTKLSVASPFSFPWKTLISDYLDQDLILKRYPDEKDELSSNFFVLRDRQELLKWQSSLKKSNADYSPRTSDNHALIPIRVELFGKGTVGANAMICIPTPGDVERRKNDKSFAGPCEKIAHDSNEDTRKKVKEEHQRLKSSLRKAWKEKKEKLKEYKSVCVLNQVETDAETVENLTDEIDILKRKREDENESYVQDKQREMWLPKCDNVKDSCSRTILGFLVEGGYSYRVGKHSGLGFVSLWGLGEYLAQKTCPEALVLVRQTTSLQYRFAKMSIVL